MYLVDLLENVQKNFIRKLSVLSNFNCIERLRICKLEALEIRRIRIDILFINYYIILLKVIYLVIYCCIQMFMILEVTVSNLRYMLI